MTVPSLQAERYHRARVEFVEAMEAGCSIIELRQRKAALRVRLRERAQQSIREAAVGITGRQGHLIIDEAADFARWDSRWMMRD